MEEGDDDEGGWRKKSREKGSKRRRRWRREEDGAYIVYNLVYFPRVEFHATSAVAGLLRNGRICLIPAMT